ncbi:hypothetical protein GALMADRAFT_226269 [Galerina marginata CBS 339.88]|uniref:Uncharacterized protein n=1 Tax=Galerina marginata (strain CBS 339.88) TaxID=685588 RepID=A0A067SXL0_GALM3|nr:hypothetical protein GALMADRAFT_226269 [Galerina marginata CBS 339.88]
MSLSRLPLPSIHHVLEAKHPEGIPRRPSVITLLDDEQPDEPPATTSTFPTVDISYIQSTSHLMKTIDLRYTEPIAKADEEQFSFIVHFADEQSLEADSDADAETIFGEGRPSTSRGFRSSRKGSDKHDLSLLIINTVRKVLPLKLAEALLRRTN